MVVTDRAISTVMDVAMALLIISASVLLIGIYLHSDDRSIDGDRGDQALQTLHGSTLTVTYDLRAVNESGHAATDSEHYDTPENLEPGDVGELYRITTYGSATDLLGEAALTNVHVGDTELFAYGYDVERSVDGAIRSRSIGSEGSVYALATWEPYDGASINGTATAGSRPPQTGDVSSATTVVSANVPALDAENLAASFDEGEARRVDADDGFDVVGEDIAEAIVGAYFPPEQTQYTLESSLTENAVTLYNYRQLAEAVGVDIEDEITGMPPSAFEANEVLRGDVGDDDGLTEVIADDLRHSPAGEEIRETYDGFGGGSITADERADLEKTFDEVVSTGTIDITVQTWD